MSITTILTDIEGTTTDIRFVHDVLFPYARAQLPAYLEAHWNDEALQPVLDAAREAAGQPDADCPTLTRCFIDWIDQDKKVTPLKTLQGLIWVAGYQQGDFTGHLYPDALEGLKRWHAAGIKLNIFSSGSVKAQKLLFGYSDFGDLTPLFDGYYDTHIGHKREPDAYQAIAAAIGESAENILFLSDVIEELDAAKSAGMQTYLLARDTLPAQSEHRVVQRFDQISL